MNRTIICRIVGVVLVLSLLLPALVSSPASASTEVGGPITGNTTWTKANSPYIVTGSVLVQQGVTLTIEPGVVVKFDSSKAIQVEGELIAKGTEAEPITFTSNKTSPAAGDWVDISFEDSSVDATYDGAGTYISGSVMKFCNIEYGGGGAIPALKIVQSSPFIDHCNIRNNAYRGIYIQQASLKITNNAISGNGAEGIIGSILGTSTIANNSVIGNSGTGISVGDGSGSVTISGNTISHNLGIGISAWSSNSGAYTYTINGNAISNNSDTGIYTGYSIVNISGNIISHNNSAGKGGGITIFTDVNTAHSEVNVIGNDISDNSGVIGGGIFAHISMGYLKLILSSNTILNNIASAEGGGVAVGGTDVTINDNCIQGNSISGGTGKGGGIYIAGPQPAINYNDIYSNTPYDVYNANSQGSPHVNATNNWWGTVDEASIQAHIYDWIDDAKLGIVDYIPYLTSPYECVDISLKAGWNMVSLPVTPGNSSVNAVFPGVAAVYTWNPTTKNYLQPTTIEPCKAYWVASTQDTTITVCGEPVICCTIDIKAGWNMIGAPFNTANISDPDDDPDGCVQPFAYTWDSVMKSYVMTTNIEPGKGYWLASLCDCTLTLQPQPYKVGAVFATTGASSNLGVPEKQTVDMIAEEINAVGGINGHPLQVIFYNTETDAAKCVTLATRLIEQDNVLAIIGPTTSGESLAIIDTITSSQTPLISCGASNNIVQPVSERYWIFKTPHSDSLSLTKIVDYLKKAGISKVALLTDTSSYGSSGRAVLQVQLPNAGISIVSDQTYGAGATDMTAQLTVISGTDAQAVINWGNNPGSAIIAKNMKTLNMTITLIGGPGIANKEFIDLAEDAANGVVFPAGKLLIADQLPDSDPQKALLLKYKNDYEANYGAGTANAFGGHAYDALMMVVEALGKVGPDRAKIRDYIENDIDNWIGIDGIFNMSALDHNGLGEDDLVMIKIVNKQWTWVQ